MVCWWNSFVAAAAHLERGGAVTVLGIASHVQYTAYLRKQDGEILAAAAMPFVCKQLLMLADMHSCVCSGGTLSVVVSQSVCSAQDWSQVDALPSNAVLSPHAIWWEGSPLCVELSHAQESQACTYMQMLGLMVCVIFTDAWASVGGAF